MIDIVPVLAVSAVVIWPLGAAGTSPEEASAARGATVLLSAKPTSLDAAAASESKGSTELASDGESAAPPGVPTGRSQADDVIASDETEQRACWRDEMTAPRGEATAR